MVDVRQSKNLRFKAGRKAFSRAFARTDLLVLVPIVGVLLILGVLRISKSGHAASMTPSVQIIHRLQCLANLKELSAAELMYATDHRGKFCPSYLNYNSDEFKNVWMGALAAYHGRTNGEWLCPSTTNPPVHSYKGAADSPWTYMDRISETTTRGSYALNGYLGLGRDYKPTKESSFKTRNVFHNTAAVQRPNLTPVFCDAIYWNCRLDETDSPSRNLYQPAGTVSARGSSVQILTQFIARHGDFPASEAPRDITSDSLPGAINLAFVDGHAENVPLENLWTLYWHRNWTPQKVPSPHPSPK